jgi:hypothetical protein
MSGRPRRNKRSGCACCGERVVGLDDEEDVTEPKVFGEKGGYWGKYSEITDKYDDDMMERLNTGLDNLLIFVSYAT